MTRGAREAAAARGPRWSAATVPGLLLVAGLAACGGDDGPPPTSPEALAGATYMTEATASGQVTLEDGELRLTGGGTVQRIALQGSAQGDLDGDGEADAAAVLVEESGLARMLRLHALLADGDSTVDVATRMLGDRFQLRSVSVDDGLVEVRLLTRPPGAPVQTRPTVPTRLRFALTDRGLRPVNPPLPREGEVRTARTPPTLTSNQWNLTRVQVHEWSAEASAFRQTPYLRFAEELGDAGTMTGELSGQAGCNRLFSSFEASAAGSLRIHALASTRRACAGDVMDRERRLLAALGAARGYSITGDTLDIEIDGGSLRFAAGPELSPPEPAQDLDGEAPSDSTGEPGEPGEAQGRSAGRRRT